MSKTASEKLKEKLVVLSSESTAKKTFSVSSFESEASKVKETFEETLEIDEHIQPRKAFKL